MPENIDIHFVPFHDDLLAQLASEIITTNTRGPDLSQTLVLLPNLNASGQLRRLLLEAAAKQNIPALLGPAITTLRAWIDGNYHLEKRIASNAERELILVDELRQHTRLLGKSSPWALAESLLTLFDELTLNSNRLPASLDSFIDALRSAYGVNTEPLTALDMEARLVYSLWHAWHEQLEQESLLDPQAAYLMKLDQACAHSTQHQFYIAGYNRLLPAEVEWVKIHQASSKISFFIHADRKSLDFCQTESSCFSENLLQLADVNLQTVEKQLITHPQAGALDEIYSNPDQSMLDRSAALVSKYPDSPIKDSILLHEATNTETEAEAVDIQVRDWILQGKNNIGIITQDRKLARRIRALLERANVQMHDAAGWALSTTSAAAIVERWLRCIEEDFDHRPLLDCLKSPFIFPDWPHAERMQAVFRLEQDIIRHENIPRDIQRFRAHIKYRQSRLDNRFPDATPVLALLDRIETAAKPLLDVCKKGQLPPVDFLSALSDSIERLGIDQTFSNDEAGKRILDIFIQLRNAVANRRGPVSWQEFRNLLGKTLEQHDFAPPVTHRHVTLMSLEQSATQRFDALIIAGCDSRHLPGSIETTPFFNDRVRAQLNIPLKCHDYNDLFYHFRQALFAAPSVILTYRKEDNGEPALPGPWLEILRAFHSICYNDDLVADRLGHLVSQTNSRVKHEGDSPAPVTSQRPAPSLESSLIPATVSVSSHQRLIDCPYQCFIADGLQLTPADEVRESMEKADYGEMVHYCLRAFHSNTDWLPGPFEKPLQETTRNEAIAMLEELSGKVFRRNVEDNFLHRGWFKRWQQHIPAYIDWQITRASIWQVSSVEEKLERNITPGLKLKGRLDRIDRYADEYAIIDYKTGGIPEQKDVLNGESIQLAAYSLLTDVNVTRVEYIMLDESPVKGKRTVKNPELAELSAQVSQRLSMLSERLANGHGMPAWGDIKTCGYCRFQGICRKDAWQDTPNGSGDRQA